MIMYLKISNLALLEPDQCESLNTLCKNELFVLFKNKNLIIDLNIEEVFIYGEKLEIDESNLEIVLGILRRISIICPQTQTFFSNSKFSKEILNKLINQNSELSVMNYLTILGGLSEFSIYASYEFRKKLYLPVEDEFYLNLPAYKTRLLKSGGIETLLVNDFNDFEKTFRSSKKVAEYYVSFLKEKGLFGKLDINNWRTVNRDLLEEKGFILPEWK